MRNFPRVIIVVVYILSMFMALGCSSVRAPRFEAVGVREIERTDARTVYSFAIKATNPNKEPIPLRQLSYTVTLDGTHSFTGVRSPETTLHTYSSHTFELPAVFEVSSGEIAGTIDYKLSGSAKYLKPGKLAEVMFDSGLKVPKSKFTLRGQVNTDQ